MKKESEFQASLIKEIKDRFPGSIVYKNDPYIQGFPDLTIFYGPKWATLEVKRCADAARQPNQEYYVEKLNKMGFSSFIFPENKEAVLDAMEQSLKGRTRRSTRVSKSVEVPLDQLQ